MKEGIRIAVLHRQRVLLHFETALCDSETMLENYQIAVTAFNNSLNDVFKVKFHHFLLLRYDINSLFL